VAARWMSKARASQAAHAQPATFARPVVSARLPLLEQTYYNWLRDGQVDVLIDPEVRRAPSNTAGVPDGRAV
jgi:hypothetical protein